MKNCTLTGLLCTTLAVSPTAILAHEDNHAVIPAGVVGEIETTIVGKDVLPMAGEYVAEVLLAGLAKFVEGSVPEGLDLADPFGFRVSAGYNHLLAGANLHDFAIGLQAVHPRYHDHIK